MPRKTLLKGGLQLALLAAASGVLPLPCGAENLPVELTQPTTIVLLPWGSGPGEVRNSPETGPGEGAPTSFLMDDEGRLHILDAANFRILLDVLGKPRPPLDLMAAGVPRADSYLVDFDIAPGGDFLVLDQVGGTALRYSAEGKALERFGHFVSGAELACGPDGRVYVRDSYVPAVNVFSRSGEFERERRGPFWTVHVDSRGRHYKAQLVGVKRGLISRARGATAKPSPFAVIGPVASGWELAEVRLVGLDRLENVYVMTTDVLEEKVKFGRLLRFDPAGDKTGELAIPRSREFFSTLPRFYRVTPAGDVLTFATHEPLGYSILKFTFPR